MDIILEPERAAKIYWQDKTRGINKLTERKISGRIGEIINDPELIRDYLLRSENRYEASPDVYGSIWVCDGGYPYLQPGRKCFRYSESSKKWSFWENKLGRIVKVGSNNDSYVGLNHSHMENCLLSDIPSEALVVAMLTDVLRKK